MDFDKNNQVVALCAKGMEREGQGFAQEAKALFAEAWRVAETNTEKFIAAHYLARQQPTVTDKLQWDERALFHALTTEDRNINAALPSLYLNIGKCYSDLGRTRDARQHYENAERFTTFLPDDGYGNMIRSGIRKALGETGDKK